MKRLSIGMALTLVAVVFLLASGTAQAATVIFDPDDPEKAIGIDGLNAFHQLWNVAFTGSTTAASVYGDFPGTFDLTTSADAEAAANAVNAVLTDNMVAGIGDADSAVGIGFYRVGFESGLEGDIESVFFWEGLRGDGASTTWGTPTMADADSYNLGKRPWATFTLVPEPSSTLLLGLGLGGFGMIAQTQDIANLR